MDSRASEVEELLREIMDDPNMSLEEKYDTFGNLRDSIIELQDNIEFDRGEEPPV